MSGVRPASDANAEVREAIENGFSKLKEWLDMRLQQQEKLLQCIKDDCKSPGKINSKDDLAVQDFMCSDSKAVEMTNEIARLEPKPCSSNAWIEVLPLPGEANADSQFQTHSAFSFHPSESKTAVESENILDNKRMHELKGETHIDLGNLDKGCRTHSEKRDTKSYTKKGSHVVQDWQSKLMDIFDRLDSDGSGNINCSEFMEAFAEAGMPNIQAFEMFKAGDETANGTIGRVEWLHLVNKAAKGSDDEIALLIQFLDRLTQLQDTRGSIYVTRQKRKPSCILQYNSPVRMVWDMTSILFLFYVSISVPFSLGFGQSNVLDVIDVIADVFFCSDVILNFRTSYMDVDGSVIVESKYIAMKYLRSWFALDFVSSVPWDLITGGLFPNLTPVRLLKLGKISKAVKLLRVSKMMHLAESEFAERVESFLTSHDYQTFSRILKLACMAFLVAHWLACFGNLIDKSSLNVYFQGLGITPTALEKYLAGIYWAMTTLSTVGYGDITPKTDEERIYAMVAMVIGGSLYGYVIGSVTSIVTGMDVSSHAYQERMELIRSWLESHREVPPSLRSRVRKHFRRAIAAKSLMEDSLVVAELSPELRADMAFFLIHDHVKNNPLFSNIPNNNLAKLVEVLRKNHVNAQEYVVKVGDLGVAMYILVDGLARYEEGETWLPPDMRVPISATRFMQVAQGDSFGEEIMFGLAETHTYTIMALTDCEFHSISEDDFRKRYQNMPELRSQMYVAYLNSRKAHAQRLREVYKNARKFGEPKSNSNQLAEHHEGGAEQDSFQNILPQHDPVALDDA